jgi:NACHT conflict system protein
MNPILEGIVANLVSSLIGELAGSARRRLSGDPVQNALKEAVAEALEAALKESGLSPEDCERYADSLCELFQQEKVLSELAPLLDPRPDLSLDLDRLAREFKGASLDLRGLPGFDLKAFLAASRSFYSAVGRQEATRDLM